MSVQAWAQEPPWLVQGAPYVPFWIMPVPNQAIPVLPPRYLPPREVPFPMPFWYWYAPPPGGQALQERPAAPAEAKGEARSEARPETRSEQTPPAVPMETTVSSQETVQSPVPPPSDATVHGEAPRIEAAGEQPDPVAVPVPEPKTEAKAEPVAAPIPAPMKPPQEQVSQKAVSVPKANTARKPLVTPVQPAAVASTTTPKPASKPASTKKARKLCWKNGRLDVCE
jgi:hypothetical protein